jgi:hypothetical protein
MSKLSKKAALVDISSTDLEHIAGGGLLDKVKGYVKTAKVAWDVWGPDSTTVCVNVNTPVGGSACGTWNK